MKHGHLVVKQKLRLSVDRIDVRLRELRIEIEELDNEGRGV
jgi:hypothetical protein